MKSIEPLLNKVLHLRDQKNDIEVDIWNYIEEAEILYEQMDDEEKDNEKDYLDSIKSYEFK